MRSAKSFTDAVSGYANDLLTLLRLNADMLKSEAAGTVRGVVMLAVLGALAFASVTMLTVFLSASAFFWLLTMGQTPLMAALIISGVFLALTAGLGFAAMSRARRIEMTPHRTIDQIQKDWQAFKSSLSGSPNVR